MFASKRRATSVSLDALRPPLEDEPQTEPLALPHKLGRRCSLEIPPTNNACSLDTLPSFVSDVHIRPLTAAESEPSIDVASSRPRWRSRVDYLVTCFGFVIGLPTVWRFPYVCYENGGGSFLFAFLMLNALIGLPMYQLELSLGQTMQASFVRIWPTFSRKLAGLGLSSVILASIAATYFAVITSWALYYLLGSWFIYPPPWTVGGLDRNDSATKYFLRNVLRKSPAITEIQITNTNVALGVCLALVWSLVFLSSIGSLTRAGLVSAFSALFPILGLVGFSLYGLGLEGAGIGLQFFLLPSVRQLFSIRLWGRAMLQVFFSSGIGWGSLVNYASFSNPRNNFMKDASIVMSISVLTSFLAGFSVFCILGHIAKTSEASTIADVIQAGSGLIYVVYPSLLRHSRFIISAFFILIISLGLSSVLTMVSLLRTSLVDSNLGHQATSFRSSGMTCLALFLGGLPLICPNGVYLVELLDASTGAIALLVVPLLEVLLITRVARYERFVFEVKQSTGIELRWVFNVLFKYVFPMLLFLLALGAVVDFYDVRHNSAARFSVLGGHGCLNSCGHGTCDVAANFCRCDAGWGGLECEIPMPPGVLSCPENCNGRGICVEGQCNCFAEFAGETCGESNYQSDAPVGAKMLGWLVALGSLMPAMVVGTSPQLQDTLMSKLSCSPAQSTMALLKSDSEDEEDFMMETNSFNI